MDAATSIAWMLPMFRKVELPIWKMTHRTTRRISAAQSAQNDGSASRWVQLWDVPPGTVAAADVSAVAASVVVPALVVGVVGVVGSDVGARRPADGVGVWVTVQSSMVPRQPGAE